MENFDMENTNNIEEKKVNTRVLKAVIITIASLITIGCVIFGLFRFMRDGFRKPFSGSNGTFGVDDSTTLYGTITSVKVDMAMGDLTIKYGEIASISIDSGNAEYAPTYTLEDGVLTVKQKSNSSFSLFGNGGMGSDVVITLPDSLESLDVTLNMGELNIKDISADDVDIVLNMGDCEIKSVTFGECDCKLNMGAADFKDISFENLDLSCDMGAAEIDVVGDLSDYSIDANASLGSIMVGNNNYSGHYTTKDGTYTLDVDCSMGSITIK